MWKCFLEHINYSPWTLPPVCDPRVLTWLQREACSPFSAVRLEHELMEWTHHTTSLRLDQAHLSLQPPPLRVTSRCCQTWRLPLFPPGSHSTCGLSAGPWSFRSSASTAGSQALGSTCSSPETPSPPGCHRLVPSLQTEVCSEDMCSGDQLPRHLSSPSSPPTLFLIYLVTTWLLTHFIFTWFLLYCLSPPLT